MPAKEWMRICFELLDLLKAHKKSIRRAAVNSFGYIAKAIGPQDVLSVLLTNLKVQERQSRVCSTVAIGRSPDFLCLAARSHLHLQPSSPRHVDLSPVYPPSSTSTARPNSTCEMDASRRCHSFLNTSAKCPKTTFTPWSVFWKTP